MIEKPQDNNNNFIDLISHNKIFSTVIIALVILAIVWIWKDIQIRNLKSEHVANTEAFVRQAEDLFVKAQEEKSRTLAKPFSWSVRTELLRGNLSQVHAYNNEMVKEKNFQWIMVANGRGVIVSSTNKRDEGKDFSNFGNKLYLTADSTVVEYREDSTMMLSTPIMGLNSRIGTIIISYFPERPSF